MRAAAALMLALVLPATALATPVINELVANHTGTDSFEFVEVKGDPSTDHSDVTILQIEGDSEAGRGHLDSAIAVGTTDAGGYWVTPFMTNQLHNGTMTLLLVRGFSGAVGADLDANDDGVLDSTPWTQMLDAVAISDGGAGDATYALPVLTGGFDGVSFTPGGLSRIPDGVDTDAVGDWTRNDFDGAGLPGYTGTLAAGEAYNTPGRGNSTTAPPPRPALLNEVILDHAGVDTYQLLEVAGDPVADYSGVSVLVLDGDGALAGRIDHVEPVGTTGSAGLWSITVSEELPLGTCTVLLVTGFSGAVGQDLDTDDDGVLDATPWSELWDAVAFSDGGASDTVYATTVLAPGFDGDPAAPGGASRLPSGDPAGAWVRNDFEGYGLPGLDGTVAATEAYNTPGWPNAGSAALYYASADAADPAALRASLHELIDDHTRVPYTSGLTDVWDVVNLADQDPNDATRILDVYKNASYAKIAGGSGAYNREHSWPNSYGFSDDQDPFNFPYSDAHHLFASDVGYNGARGNLPYGACDTGCAEYATDVNDGAGGGTGVYPGNSNWQGSVWETWIGRRGDVARALLYMDVRYEGGTNGVTGTSEPDLVLTDEVGLIQITSSSPAYMGLLSVLLEWHQEDPVDARERWRNDIVWAHQGNRNPFVDHPEWALCVFGTRCAPIFSDGFDDGNTTAWSAAVGLAP